MTVQPYEPAAEVESFTPDAGPGRDLIEWAQALSSAHQIATALCKTSFVPKHFAGRPDEAAAALMLGSEVGLSPVSSLRSIYVISGTPSMYARAMVAIAQSSGHEVWTVESTDAKVTVCGRRRGSAEVERVTWTTDRARKAGYTSNKKYETDPQAMLYARAASDVVRRIAADALAGIPHSVEELELEQPATATRKVSRSKPEPPPVPEPEIAPEAKDPDGITSAQQKKLGATMREYGITERDAALAYVADVIGRDVTSRSELTKDEAGRVIDALERGLAESPEPPVEARVAELNGGDEA